MFNDLVLILLSIEQLNRNNKHKLCAYCSNPDIDEPLRCAFVRCSSCLLNPVEDWGEPKYVEHLIVTMEIL